MSNCLVYSLMTTPDPMVESVYFYLDGDAIVLA
jgi:hypothetical protein